MIFTRVLAAVLGTFSQFAMANGVQDYSNKNVYTQESYQLCATSDLPLPQLEACVDSAVTSDKFQGCLALAKARNLSPRVIYGCADHFRSGSGTRL